MKRALIAIFLMMIMACSVSAQDATGARPDPWQQQVQLRVQNVPFVDALRQLFSGSSINLVVPSDISGFVPLVILTDTRRAVLDALCKMQPDVGYTITSDGVTFFKKANAGVDTSVLGGRVTSLSFSNTPFAIVVSSLLDPVKASYTIMPGLEQARVTAVLNNLPVDDALRQVTQAAGVSYKKESIDGKDAYTFSLAAQNDGQLGNQTQQYVPYRPSQNSLQLRVGNSNDSITLNYLNSAAIMPLANSQPDIQVTNSGGNFLALRGSPEAIKSFKGMVAAVDRPESMPRSVRVRAIAEVTVVNRSTPRKPAVSRLTTESLGIEGTSMPVTINVGGATPLVNGGGPHAPANASPTDNLQMRLDVTPTIQSAAPNAAPMISLTGHGIINGHLPMEFSKEFDFAVSTAPNVSQTIAQGSADIGNSSVSFAVNMTASIEKGRVQLPANGIQGGYYGNGMGNSYGGYNQNNIMLGNGNRQGFGGMQNRQALPGNQPPTVAPNGPRPPANPPAASQPVQPPPAAPAQQNKQ